jgi:hypothetical protein
MLDMYIKGLVKGGFYSERPDAFIISPNRQPNHFPELEY